MQLAISIFGLFVILLLLVGGSCLLALLLFRKTRLLAASLLGLGLVGCMLFLVVLGPVSTQVVHRRSSRAGPVRFEVNVTRLPHTDHLPTNAAPANSSLEASQGAGAAEVTDDEQFLAEATGPASGLPAVSEIERPADGGNRSAADAVARPAWVDQREIDFDHDPQTMVIHSGPWKSRTECAAEVEKQLRASLVEYYDWFLLHHDRQLPSHVKLLPTEQDIGRLERTNTFVETIAHPSFGEMQELHLLLTIDERFRDHLARRIQEAIVGDRMGKTAWATGAVLAGLSLVFGGLKLRQSIRARRMGASFSGHPVR